MWFKLLLDDCTLRCLVDPAGFVHVLVGDVSSCLRFENPNLMAKELAFDWIRVGHVPGVSNSHFSLATMNRIVMDLDVASMLIDVLSPSRLGKRIDLRRAIGSGRMDLVMTGGGDSCDDCPIVSCESSVAIVDHTVLNILRWAAAERYRRLEGGPPLDSNVESLKYGCVNS